MSLVVEGQTYKWEGGTLEELLSLLAEAALSVRVEALHADREEKLGEIHVVAGGVSETIAGERRGDAAMTYLRQIPGLRFLASPVLPNPEDGALGAPGPLEGTLAQRPPPALMRYCENFVLTCALELRHADDHVRVSYRRGEILRTLVNGSESGERLPEVMSWTEGTWRISLPQLALPRPPKAARPLRPPAVDSSTIFGYQVQLPLPASGSSPPPAPMNEVQVTVPYGGNAGSPPAPTAPVTAPIAPPAVADSAHVTERLRRLADAPTPMVESIARPPATIKPEETLIPEPKPATPSPATPVPSATPEPERPRQGAGGFFASLLLHALLGVALGLAIVGGYWAFLRWGNALRLGS
jgi:hypothetical protein